MIVKFDERTAEILLNSIARVEANFSGQRKGEPVEDWQDIAHDLSVRVQHLLSETGQFDRRDLSRRTAKWLSLRVESPQNFNLV